MPVDETKLNTLMERIIGDLGAAFGAALVVLGDKLGLYKAMAGKGPMTPADLARETRTAERYVREWLNSQAAAGFVTYDAETGRYHLSEEQAYALADEGSPVFIPGAFQIISSVVKDEPKIAEAFRSGKGLAWHEHEAGLFEGTERFFRPNYAAHLVEDWIPSLDGVEEKLKEGARVADVGCGHGASTVLMAQAYPESTFVGFDYHPASIERARRRAEDVGVTDRVQFEVATAKTFPGDWYDLVACFDCLHDMGDPVGAARHVRESLGSEGTWMIVEPRAGDRVQDNLNPIGRVFYAASTLICTPASVAQEVGLALGAQAGEEALRRVVRQGGFSSIRRAAETPFNMVLEARP